MKIYLYLSLTPEALIASMLPIDEFGKYLAIGPRRQSSAPAMFLELDSSLAGEEINEAMQRCQLHPDGRARRSTYLSIYRALEVIPLQAVKSLNLVTNSGFTLTLRATSYVFQTEPRFYLYQEYCPVTPRVISRLEPCEFCRFITNPAHPVYVPRILFSDLRLDALATDPSSKVGNLPYSRLEHLRECLLSLQRRPDKKAKIVNRDLYLHDIYYQTEKGFYLGDRTDFIFFPMPDEDTLNRDHHIWWTSAKAHIRY